MSHLARFLLQQTQTTTDLVDRLERRGLVQRVRHETDRRVVLVEITNSGRDVLGTISEAFGSVAQEAFGAVSQESLVDLTGTMRQVRDVAARAGGVPGEHLSYAEQHLNIALLVGGASTNAAAD
jgi:DNA-binding MarR family transcriptional regulator